MRFDALKLVRGLLLGAMIVAYAFSYMNRYFPGQWENSHLTAYLSVLVTLAIPALLITHVLFVLLKVQESWKKLGIALLTTGAVITIFDAIWGKLFF